MARPRTPTAVLELRGAFKNHPSRLNARKYEPIVTSGLPDPAEAGQVSVGRNASLWLLADKRR